MSRVTLVAEQEKMPDAPRFRSQNRDEEAEAAAARIRLGTPKTRPRPLGDEKGYKLYLPRPASLAVLLWVWIAVSVTYLAIGGIAGYLRIYRLPEKEGDFPLVVPGATAARFWPYLGAVIAFNIFRLLVMAAALTSPQASFGVRLGWTVAVAGSLLHLVDFFRGISSGISQSHTASVSPAPIAALAGISLLLAVVPDVVVWVWKKPEVHVPDWTYGIGEQGSKNEDFGGASPPTDGKSESSNARRDEEDGSV